MNKLTIFFIVVIAIVAVTAQQKPNPPPHGTFDLQPNGKPTATRPSGGSAAVPIPARASAPYNKPSTSFVQNTKNEKTRLAPEKSSPILPTPKPYVKPSLPVAPQHADRIPAVHDVPKKHH